MITHSWKSKIASIANSSSLSAASPKIRDRPSLSMDILAANMKMLGKGTKILQL